MIDSAMGGGRMGVVIAAITAGAGAVATEVVTKTEPQILNVPLSMLYVAIAGTMIGFYLLPSKDAARLTAPPEVVGRRRIAYAAFSYALVGFAIVAYAFISAWIVQFGTGLVASLFQGWSLHESAIIPGTALVGVGIRPMLPGLLRAVERRADRAIGGGQ
jgi:hypothetical protein